MSQFSKYTKKEMMSDDYLEDYEEYEDYEKSTSIPIYSYRNENPLDGLCMVFPNLINQSYKGSLITLSHYKDDRTCEENTSWGFPVSRFTKTSNIYNAVYACKLFYEHFNRGEVAEMLLEEYRKEPLFMKEVA